LWENPGIPSITVPYDDINDFYYSGHTGMCAICTLENFAFKNYKAAYFSIFVALSEMFVLCIVQIHYVIDLIAAIMMSYLLNRLSERLSFYIDVKFFGYR